MGLRSKNHQSDLEEDAKILDTFAKRLDATADQQERSGQLVAAAIFRRISRQSQGESLKYRARAAALSSR